MNENPIRFNFDEAKATAAAARILEFHGGSADRLRLVKLLYLVERESLRIFNRPVFGDRYFSMVHGPVVSRAYDLMKDRESDRGGLWSAHIRRQGEQTMALALPLGAGPLSPADLEVIDVVCTEHRDKNTWDLVEFTHKLPEWKNTSKTSIPIHVEELLELLDKSAAEVEKIRAEEEASAEFDQLFLGRA